MLDLLIRADRVVDPSSGLDGPGVVGIRADRIALTCIGEADASAVDVSARRVLDFHSGILLPGLVDMHAHPALDGSKYGIDPDIHMLPRGATTVLSQGDAGARNWPAYRRRVINHVRTRIKLAINLAASGESSADPCLADLADADVDACVAAIHDGADDIWGIAVNLAPAACGESDPKEILRLAIAAAERTDRPLLVGTRHADDWPLEDQLNWLRSGDVVTYCFHSLSDRIVRDGRVLDCVWRARERGVLFDIGHGMQSFDFDVAESAVKEGFLPDTISTDMYVRHVGATPPHDLAHTLSKLLAAGMAQAEAWPRVTSRPAELLGLAGEVGTLAVGACADVVVLQTAEDSVTLKDVNGKERRGRLWKASLVVRDGQLVHSPST